MEIKVCQRQQLSQYFTGHSKHFENCFVDGKPLKRCAELFSVNPTMWFLSLSLARSIPTKCALLALHNWWQTLFYTRLCCIMINFIDPFRKSWFASLRVCLCGCECECMSVSVCFFPPSFIFFPSCYLNFFRLCSLQRVFIHFCVWCTSAHVVTLVSFVVSVVVGAQTDISIRSVADCQIYLLY